MSFCNGWFLLWKAQDFALWSLWSKADNKRKNRYTDGDTLLDFGKQVLACQGALVKAEICLSRLKML